MINAAWLIKRKVFKFIIVYFNMKKRALFILILLSALFSFYVSAGQNETMTVEANIFAEEIYQDIISIEVPDYIFLGNVSKGEETDKAKIYVNNTGNVNVTITPQLKDLSDEIFRNLYFQNRQTGNNSAIRRIGNYNFNIEKPSAGGKRSEYFYMWLDLTDFEESIIENRMGERAEITFIALPQN